MRKSQGRATTRSWTGAHQGQKGFFKAPRVLSVQTGEPETTWATTAPHQAPGAPAHLHPDDGVDEEKHGNQQTDIW